MDKSEPDSLKVMIFMIEGILPECYFTDNLRGLSVDMAVFRDLLKLRIPRLSQHLDNLQKCAHEGAASGNITKLLSCQLTALEAFFRSTTHLFSSQQLCQALDIESKMDNLYRMTMMPVENLVCQKF